MESIKKEQKTVGAVSSSGVNNLQHNNNTTMTKCQVDCLFDIIDLALTALLKVSKYLDHQMYEIGEQCIKYFDEEKKPKNLNLTGGDDNV